MSRREEVLTKIRSIPAMPAAASRAMVLLRDPEVKIRDVIRSIEFDPGLTSNVLRLANSAYFGGPRSISSLRDAIVRLGMNRIFQLVITSAILPVARHQVRGYDIPSGALLEHCVSVAIGAERLAMTLNIKPPPYTYTAGLLHDLGKVVLSTFLAVNARPISELAYGEKLSFEVAESRVLGIDHAEAGAVLLANWNLPESIVDVVRYHHQPESFRGDPFVVDLVHVADHLSLEAGLGRGIDGLNYRPSGDAIARLSLPPDAAERIAYRMLTDLERLRGIIGRQSLN